MGHEGMHSSLVSREVIADSVEMVMNAERLDGLVMLAGCDKSTPGMLMAAARLDVAAAFVYAGSSLPGRLAGRDITILDAFEGVGACAAGLMTEAQLTDIERSACPGQGACAGMYTANTMAAAAEGLGIALPGSASPPAADSRRDSIARGTGKAVVRLVDKGITARDIMTHEAFENAIAVVMALGGSTNAVLHLLRSRVRHASTSTSTTSTGSATGCHTSRTSSRSAASSWQISTASAGCRPSCRPPRGGPLSRRRTDGHGPHHGREPGCLHLDLLTVS